MIHGTLITSKNPPNTPSSFLVPPLSTPSSHPSNPKRKIA